MVHLYCGEGKGKTTAAAGLAIRCAGHGKEVIFAQFMKGNKSGELEVLKAMPNVRIFQNRENLGFYSKMDGEKKEKLKNMHNETLKNIAEELSKKQCDLLVLDEITYTLNYQVIDFNLLKQLLSSLPKETEICLTGRNPDEFFVDMADYITEMKELRHPFQKGVKARAGIEF